MGELGTGLGQGLLRAGLLALITLGILGLTALSVRRPARDARFPTRRRMPCATAVIGVLVALVGALIALVGALDGGSDDQGRTMMVAGTALAALGLFLLWCHAIVVVEATPTGFRRRGVTGRLQEMAYADIARVHTTSSRGAVTVVLTGRDGRSFAAPVGMLDWDPYRAWRAARGPEKGPEGSSTAVPPER